MSDVLVLDSTAKASASLVDAPSDVLIFDAPSATLRLDAPTDGSLLVIDGVPTLLPTPLDFLIFDAQTAAALETSSPQDFLLIDVASSPTSMVTDDGSDMLVITASGPRGERGISGPPLDATSTPPPFPEVGDLWFAPNVEPIAIGSTFVVSDFQPSIAATGMWVQTGLGPDGSDFTLWVEDGL